MNSLYLAFLLGVLLLAAVSMGRLARLFRIPRVVGYLVGGLAAKLLMQRLLGGHEALAASFGLELQAVSVIKPFGLSVILFMIGTLFDRSHLRAVGWPVLKISLCESGFVLLLVLAGTWAFSPHHSFSEALFYGVIAIATAPAATLLVLQEYDAKGRTTDHIVTLTGLNNIFSIVLFFAVFLVLAEAGPIARGDAHVFVVNLLTVSIGSMVAGAVLGLVLTSRGKIPLVTKALPLGGGGGLMFMVMMAGAF